MIKAHQCLIQKTAYILKNKKMLENYAFSGTPHKPVSYIEQGIKLTCQCGYEWIENRFPVADKMKDDAIAHLSDQLMALTARMQDLERRQ